MPQTENAPILLCYDRSDGARRAIECTAALLPGREAIVLHVWSPIALTAFAYAGMVALPAYDSAELGRAALTLAEEGAAIASAAGLAARAATAESTYEGTWHAIIAAAEEHGAGLIAIGARGLSTFRSIVLGSVSHGVVEHAACPVLVIPPVRS